MAVLSGLFLEIGHACGITKKKQGRPVKWHNYGTCTSYKVRLFGMLHNPLLIVTFQNEQ